jgi:Transposase DNA-binding
VEDANVVAVMGEFEGIDLGHEKRNRRVKRVVAALGAKPDASFPEAMGNDAELEGLYRLLNNKQVNAAKLLAPHCAETVERVEVETPASGGCLS